MLTFAGKKITFRLRQDSHQNLCREVQTAWLYCVQTKKNWVRNMTKRKNGKKEKLS
jgi:hypothetical protein